MLPLRSNRKMMLRLKRRLLPAGGVTNKAKVPWSSIPGSCTHVITRARLVESLSLTMTANCEHSQHTAEETPDLFFQQGGT